MTVSMKRVVGSGAVELGIVIGASGRLLQERHHPGIGGKQLVEFFLLARRQHLGGWAVLGYIAASSL